MIEQKTCAALILTVKDVQNILRIGQVSAYALVRSNAFPVIRIGRSYRIPQDTFMEWIRKMDTPATASSNAIADTTCILSKLKNGGRSYGNQKF